MKSVNKVILLGHVTNDPETKKIPSGKSVCTFGLATNFLLKSPKGEKQESVEFHNLVAWGGLADLCAKTVRKGNPLYIEGRLKTGSWENAQKVKMHRTEIIVDELSLLSGKEDAKGV
jgi:single-strand DNA-binding protein